MSVLMNFSMGLKSAAAAKAVSALANRWYPVKNNEFRTGTFGLLFVNDEFWSFDSNGCSAKVSANGVTWQTVWFGTAFAKSETAVPLMTSIAYNNGKYVAVGRNFGTMTILTSYDKVNWTRVNLAQAFDLNSIVYLNGLNMFLAVGTNGNTMRSIDGDNWVLGTKLGTTTLNSVVFNGSTVAVTVSGSGLIYRSSDGINFLSASSSTSAVNSIAYSGTLGLWAIARTGGSNGAIMTSPDLITWTQRSVTGTGVPTGTSTTSGFGMTWDGNKFIVVTVAGVFSSSDGINWSVANSRVVGLGAIACNLNNGTVVAGTNGSSGVHKTADSGVTWSSSITEKVTATPFIRRSLNIPFSASASFNALHWRATSAGNIFSSADGKEWIASNVFTTVTGEVSGICAAMNAPTPYLTAVGYQSPNSMILFSVDSGKNWNIASSGSSSGIVLTACASNGTLTVAVGASGRIMTSTDGNSWVQRTSGTTNLLNCITYANGRFIAAGASVALTSVDGISWTNASTSFTTGGSVNPNVVVYDGTKFVAAGTGTATVNIKTSTDGITWANGTYAPWGTGTVRSIVQSDTAFVIMLSGARTNMFYRTGNFTSFNTTFAFGAIQSSGTPYMSMANGKIVITGSQGSYMYTSTSNGDLIEIEPMAEPTTTPTAFRTRLTILDDEVCLLNSGSPEGPALSVLDPVENLFRNEALPSAPTAIEYIGGQYLLATSPNLSTSAILTSSDRINWTTRATFNTTVLGFATNGSTIIAFTNAIGGSQINVQYSLNGGVTWANGSHSFSVAKAIWIGDKFVAVGRLSGGNGTIYTSPDGINWTNVVNSSGHNFVDLVYAKDTLVAVSSGSSQKIMTSTDGVTWSPQGLSSYSPARFVIYVESIDRFLVGSDAGLIYSSSDAVSWAVEAVGGTAMVSMVYDGISAIYAMNLRGTLFKYSIE